MRLAFSRQNSRLIVAGAGPFKLDNFSSREFYEEITHAYRAGETLVLNFENLDYLDSAGMSVLIRIRRHVLQHGGALKFACIRDTVMNLMQISRLHRVFDFYPTLEAALREEAPAAGRQVGLRAEFEFEVEARGQVALCTLRGQEALIESNCRQVLEKLNELAREHALLILDIDALRTIDSLGIDALLRAQKSITAAGKRLIFVFENPTINKLLDLYSISELIDHEQTIEAALLKVKREHDRAAGKDSVFIVADPSARPATAEKSSFVDLEFLLQ